MHRASETKALTTVIEICLIKFTKRYHKVPKKKKKASTFECKNRCKYIPNKPDLCVPHKMTIVLCFEDTPP